MRKENKKKKMKMIVYHPCVHTLKQKNSLIIKTMSPSPMLYLTSATIKKMLIPPNYQKQKE